MSVQTIVLFEYSVQVLTFQTSLAPVGTLYFEYREKTKALFDTAPTL